MHPLLKAFHAASNQHQGAEMLLGNLLRLDAPTHLSFDNIVAARAYCDQLKEAAAAAQKDYQDHVAPFDAAAYEAQQRTTTHLQAAA
jgi:hypothetical protein